MGKCLSGKGIMAVMALGLLLPASAGTVNKSGHTLFNPTPREAWRTMSADRPDFTESPITVDAGVRQLELSFFDFTRSSNASASLSVIPVNLKLGLRHNMDLQLVLEAFVRDSSDGAEIGGIGDTQLRLKINFWGNDGGDTALGIMPFIKLPTASSDLGNGKVEGGIILPFSMTLTEKLGLGLMLEVDAIYDEEEDDYGADVILSGVLGYDTGRDVGFYLEGIVLATEEQDHEVDVLLGVGATWPLSDNAAFDLGCNIGLTNDVDAFNVFSGLTFRF